MSPDSPKKPLPQWGLYIGHLYDIAIAILLTVTSSPLRDTSERRSGPGDPPL